MKDLKDRLTSRKFLFALGALVGYILLGFTGQIEWSDAFDKVSYVLMVYIGAEGAADTVKKLRK